MQQEREHHDNTPPTAAKSAAPDTHAGRSDSAARAGPAGGLVVALVADLIFASKITATAAHVGVRVQIVRTVAAARSAALDAVAGLGAASALIVDLNVPDADVLALVQQIKAARPALPIVAFLSHVQVELAKQARAAGADKVLPRSKFSLELAEILQRLAAC